ncbi:MAG: thioredoxin-dependent thiol peroxidase [Flexibacter sp. CG_4_10_14_3_um_filter_32_15]|nr:MAG: thioredoxin-dependent thiol peroxidase [Flexibacter sp. CG_4_10_14_3_um_filter_32_15]
MELKKGDKAPEFTAHDQNGHEVKLSQLKGKKVILYFYPKDDTPGCTAQACNLRDNYTDLQKQGYEVLGVSKDGVASHKKFAEKYDLQFPLLVDEDHTINEAYGVWKEKNMFGKKYMGTQRTTFVIDEEGKIEEVIKKVKTKEHAEQIIK